MAGASEAQFATTGPVGQVVKTAASHAVNIGSNPVRVTTQKQAADRLLPREHESALPPLLFRSNLQTLRWFEGWGRRESPSSLVEGWGEREKCLTIA